MIFVTGYFGAPIMEEAERIASRKGWTVLDLDAKIQEKDGRSIPRLCMMGGEHAYRNAEYEAVAALCGSDYDAGHEAEHEAEHDAGELVVACGDGILYDEAGEKLLDDHTLVALTIMVAEPRLEEKEMMISVIMNCIG